MKPVAIGVRMHSGWGALVTISIDAGAIELIDSRHLVVIDPVIPGASQPYHYAEQLEVSEAEKYLAAHATACERVASKALRDIVEELRQREYRVVGSGLVLASGRQLPTLPEILASHALIHTAEGELFRNLFRRACERLKIGVSGFAQRKLDDDSNAVFGEAATGIRRTISVMGRTVGPPWTSDQKAAALVACLALGPKSREANAQSVSTKTRVGSGE